MRVLITGAGGFIGSHLVAALHGAGHEVVAGVRRPKDVERRLPVAAAIAVDFERDTAPETWLPRLDGIDAVVNAIGILQAGRGRSADAVHHRAPDALFEACERAGVRRVIHLSAISADAAAGTLYAATKRAGEEALRRRDLDWVILRPSLIYGEGSYGGTSLLRGLAALPFVTPVVGRGEQAFQPLHIDDLAALVAALLAARSPSKETLTPAGPEVLTLRQLLARLRAWLGYPPAPFLEVPPRLMAALARLGDLVGAKTLNTTALRQLQYGNVAPPAARVPFGPAPRTLAAALAARPAHVQDRWHARCYFLRPLLQIVLGVFWLASGIVGLLAPAATRGALLAPLGLGADASVLLWLGSCALDIGIGVAVLAGWRRRAIGWLQLVVIGGYTAGLGALAPALLLDPLGPLVKNAPVAAAVVALMALADDR